MIDRPYRIHYKCVFDLFPAKDASPPSHIDDVLAVTQKYIHDTYNLPLPNLSMRRYGIYQADDRKTRAFIASAHTEKDGDSPSLWGIKIQSPDAENRRRTWTTQICLRQSAHDVITLYFLETYSDSLGGYLQPPTFVPRRAPAFIYKLLNEESVICGAGRYSLPAEPIELTESLLPHFLSVLGDDLRSLPVILNACPDLIDPIGLNQRTVGNVIQFAVSDPGLIMMLNDALPEGLGVDFDSLRIYMPINGVSAPFHPSYKLHDIHNTSARQIVSTIAQAFSENLRGAEMRDFVTVDYIFKLRHEQAHARLQDDHEKAKTALDKATKEKAALEAEVSALRASISQHSAHNLDEYEELLRESLQGLDKYTDAANKLADDIYRCIENGKPYECARPTTGTPIDGLMYALVAFTKSSMLAR